jgi:hypothetical protein
MSNQTNESVESVRKRYRPARIVTLFVGESAPHNGTFFYRGDSLMLRQMKIVVESAFGETDDIPKTFMAYGWYLDDLVLEPVNHLQKPQRKTKCLEAQKSLAARIAEYRPLAIVSLLRSIDRIVTNAAKSAGSDANILSVPFPGMGNQVRFRDAMARIIHDLPRSV